ncbi:MAG: substrate-binding domain-containing protein [Caldilineaceae bacterium]
MGRRGLLQGMMGLMAGGLLAGCQVPGTAGSRGRQRQSLSLWQAAQGRFFQCWSGPPGGAQGKETAEHWGQWMGVEVTWFDGGLSIDTQRKAIDDMAARDWDFVAIQAFGIDTLVDPVKQMIGKGIPVIQMDTTISKDDIGITTFLEPDNIYMGSVVSEAIFQKLGGAAKSS